MISFTKSTAMFYVYILSNPTRTTLYINATDDIDACLYAHRKGTLSPFTRKYILVHLIYFEIFDCIDRAEARARQLKNWHRQWKWNLIMAANPSLRALSPIDAETSSASQPLTP